MQVLCTPTKQFLSQSSGCARLITPSVHTNICASFALVSVRACLNMLYMVNSKDILAYLYTYLYVCVYLYLMLIHIPLIYSWLCLHPYLYLYVSAPVPQARVDLSLIEGNDHSLELLLSCLWLSSSHFLFSVFVVRCTFCRYTYCCSSLLPAGACWRRISYRTLKTISRPPGPTDFPPPLERPSFSIMQNFRPANFRWYFKMLLRCECSSLSKLWIQAMHLMHFEGIQKHIKKASWILQFWSWACVRLMNNKLRNVKFLESCLKTSRSSVHAKT